MATEIMTLADGLKKEVARNQELLVVYRSLPNNAGWFGSAMIQQDLQHATDAMLAGDCVKMLRAYEKLKGNE